MDVESFREFGKAAVDYLADYLENIRDRQVLPNVEPGYMRKLLPEEAPEEPERWQDVLKDMDRAIMPGLTHWHSPHFHAFYPTANSYPGIVGELLSAGLGTIGFTWMSSPASTELEVITLDWLGKMVGLPPEFLSCSPGHGGGVIQGSASEATLLCLLVARERYVQRLQEKNPNLSEEALRMTKAKLIAYTSNQSNSSVEKAGILGAVPMRLVPCDEKFQMKGQALREAIETDVKNGLIPCIVISTLGTTPTCANDPLEEISTVCKEFGVWHHVDAAYSGAALICPEYRYICKGIENTDSFNFNPHKWMLVNFDCSALWVKDSRELVSAMSVDRAYLAHTKQDSGMPDYRNWQIPLGRRFRALKLWFVLRIYGVRKLQEFIRQQCQLAIDFEQLLKSDDRFEIFTPAHMGLVTFRLKGPNENTKKLMANLQSGKKIYVVGAQLDGKEMIRFAICSRFTESSDIQFAWQEILRQTEKVFALPSKKQEITRGQK
ncbi:aromatic-L-amino-acid decarboxylase-like [Neocloeon triangulifer]|uniref:aromatic-L-amino-acid decarboxylase-like n=1 Tax=Neocloeon triangulifer TaxID=2078957 RepID=UPI00286F6021|nr:aromatic-L-amino-acid decarboxylase-like [Neocloeon triangulifer]